MKLQKEQSSSTYCIWVLLSAIEKEEWKDDKKMKMALMWSHKTILETYKGREKKKDCWAVGNMQIGNNPVLSENQVLSTICLGYQKIEGGSNFGPKSQMILGNIFFPSIKISGEEGAYVISFSKLFWYAWYLKLKQLMTLKLSKLLISYWPMSLC